MCLLQSGANYNTAGESGVGHVRRKWIKTEIWLISCAVCVGGVWLKMSFRVTDGDVCQTHGICRSL